MSKRTVLHCIICGEEFRCDPGDLTRGTGRRFCALACFEVARRRLAHVPATIARRFIANINLEGPVPSHRPELGPCHIWTRKLGRHGYGNFTCLGEQRLSHRVAWFLAHGSWPTLQILHNCDNRACVNPEHLFEGTPMDNMADMITKGRARHQRGKDASRAKLTESQVLEIRALYQAGELSERKIAKLFGVNRMTAKKAATGENWKHLPL